MKEQLTLIRLDTLMSEGFVEATWPPFFFRPVFPFPLDAAAGCPTGGRQLTTYNTWAMLRGKRSEVRDEIGSSIIDLKRRINVETTNNG
jgi:hypothetical protein